MTIRDRLETKVLQKLSRPGTSSGFRQWILDVSDVGPEDKVIDVATAIGGTAFDLLKKTSHVTAIDASPERIEIAKNDPRAAAINFMVADAGDLPFTDYAFDIAIIVLGLHEMGEKNVKRALIEAHRISQRLIVVEFGIDRWPLIWSFLRYPVAIIEPPGFLKFTRLNLGSFIEKTGWTILRREADFPFELFVCG